MMTERACGRAAQFVAWRLLPRSIVYWCAVRLFAHATVGSLHGCQLRRHHGIVEILQDFDHRLLAHPPAKVEQRLVFPEVRKVADREFKTLEGLGAYVKRHKIDGQTTIQISPKLIQVVIDDHAQGADGAPAWFTGRIVGRDALERRAIDAIAAEVRGLTGIEVWS